MVFYANNNVSCVHLIMDLQRHIIIFKIIVKLRQ